MNTNQATGAVKSTELAAIRDALAELPAETRGTWRKLDKLPYIHVTEDPKASPWGTPCIGRFDYMDTADYMVACNPAAMTAVLAYVDALQAEIQALRADARRLDWIFRQGDEFACEIIHDAPGDGDYFVHGIGAASGQGKTARAAIDAAVSASGEGGQ